VSGILDTVHEPLNRLQLAIGEVVDLQRAALLLEWDEQVYMPPGGAPVHGDMVATIRKTAHEKLTADEIGRLIEELEPALPTLAADSDEHRIIAVTARDYHKAVRVPAAFVAEQAQAVSTAQHLADRRAHAGQGHRAEGTCRPSAIGGGSRRANRPMWGHAMRPVP